MIFFSILALGFLQSKPELAAVQLWGASGPVRAWSPDGRILTKTISVEHGDDGLPDKPGAVELVALLPSASGHDFPSAYWKVASGFKRTSESSSWKDDDPKSGLAAFSLLGFPNSREADVALNVASGPLRVVSGPVALRLNAWKATSGGFRVRVRNRFVNDHDQDHVKHAFLEIVPPLQYRNWEISPLVKSKSDQLECVSFDSSGQTRIYKLEKGAAPDITLTIRARPFAQYRFDHIPLKPR